MKIVDICLRYLAQGWSVVPVAHGSKHPTIDWKTFQTVRASEGEARAWTDEGLAVVCGEVSGNLVCLDFDELDAYGRWLVENTKLALDLPTAVSSRGVHVFFRTPTPIRSGKFVVRGEETHAGDLISEGKLVVLPPTVHPDGFVRRWDREPFYDIPVMTLGAMGVERHLRSVAMYERKDVGEDGVTVGERHSAVVAAALRLRKGGFRGRSLAHLLFAFNLEHCKPPLTIDEVDGIANWTSALEDKDMQIVTRVDPITGRSSMLISHDDVERYDEAFESAEDYVKGEETEMQWLVDGFLPAGYLVVLGGTSKAGKSCFVTALSLAIAKGEGFMGMRTTNSLPRFPAGEVGEQSEPGGGSSPEYSPHPSHDCVGEDLSHRETGEGIVVTAVDNQERQTQNSVLWCAYEESKPERLLTLREYGALPSNFYITHCKPLIDTEDGLALLKHNIIKHGARFVVVDPLYGASASESLTDGKSARNALSGLKDLCNELGVTIVIIHHLTKNVNAGLVRERMADSNQILATASMDMLLDSKDSDGCRLLKLKCRGRGSFANQTWIIRSTGVAHYELISHGEDAEMPKAETAKEAILRLLQEQGPMDAESLAGLCDISYSTARKNLALLIDDGFVDVSGKELGRKQYALVGGNLFAPPHP